LEQRVSALEARVGSLALRLDGVEGAAAARGGEPDTAAGRGGVHGTVEAPPAGRASPARLEAAPAGIEGSSRAGRGSPARLEAALARFEGSSRGAAPAPGRRVAIPHAGELEDLLGGRVLAWTGGATVLVGIVLLFALAVSRGWLDPTARVLLAGGGALALLALGVWLEERRGRTDAARAAVATGVAGLYATVAAAAQLYELLPAPAAVALALGAGAMGTGLALRWDSRGVAALGIMGGVLAPALVGAPPTAGTLVLLWVALASAVGVLLRRRWTWLGLLAVVAAAAQWVPWLLEAPALPAALLVLVGFGGLGAVAAVGFELRDTSARVHAAAYALLALNALVASAAGWLALAGSGHRELADAWPAALAVGHLALGVGGLRLTRLSRELALLSLCLGVVLADLAFGLVASGPLLVVGWAAGAPLFALLGRRSHRPEDELLAGAGVGGHVALGLGHALLGDAPPSALLGGTVDTGPALLALASLAAGCFASARLAADGRRGRRLALDGVGLALVAYSAALLLDGPALVAAWSLEAVALARLARARGDGLAAGAAVLHAAAAAAHVLLVEAPPWSLVDGLPDVAEGVVALGALAAAALGVRHLGPSDPRWQAASSAAAGSAVLFLASCGLISAFQPGGGAVPGLLDLGVREQGQVLLDALWAVVGVGALLVGLRRDRRGLRAAALGLLLLTVGKVFLYDLAALTSLYRVASFVGLGLFLLLGAFAWQRARPRPPADLREVPAAMR
jgi:uncharacterized membrane protein